jgi:hypothetical protein
MNLSSDQLSRMLRRMIGLCALLAALVSDLASSYTIPELNRRAMAGLWKLSKQIQQQHPMKEFTVYPKPSASRVVKAAEEYLLMLKEDGSFRQFLDGDEEEKNRERIIKRVIAEKTKEQTVLGLGFQKGTWDFVDGKLLLAAERPGGVTNDTLLVGKVVAISQTSLRENPIAHDMENSTSVINTARDTHLSVPKGSVKIGKFFYPRKHPSFFEQPMFNPLSGDRFQLNQVLGMLNTARPEDVAVEKFRRADFANKTFLLTSHPIPEFKPKGNLRWSIRYSKFVEDPLKGKKGKTDDEDDERLINAIRVMEVQLFSNQTFCTTGGFGNAAVLRGKWDLMGDQRDKLWLQVWLFGFGRSVSGSTFSEGQSLTQDDAKMYFGTIGYVGDDDEPKDNTAANTGAGESTATMLTKRLQVKGSVILGSGLEPLPVARFIMTEKEEEIDDEEEEDEEEMEAERLIERLDFTAGGDSVDRPDGESGIDWSSAFQ